MDFAELVDGEEVVQTMEKKHRLSQLYLLPQERVVCGLSEIPASV